MAEHTHIGTRLAALGFVAVLIQVTVPVVPAAGRLLTVPIRTFGG